MSLPIYGVFKGKGGTIDEIRCETPREGPNQKLEGQIICTRDEKDNPHYSFNVKSALADDFGIEIKVNVRSSSTDNAFTRNLYCYFSDDFQPQNAMNFSLENLKQLAYGLTILDFNGQVRKESGIALDYLRSSIFILGQPTNLNELFVEVPTTRDSEEGEYNDLNEFIHDRIRRAQKSDADIYILGDAYPRTPRNFRYPRNISNEEERRIKLEFLDRHGLKGMHDVHMNQGNTGKEEWIEDNGVFQDGALIIHFKQEDKWSVIFLRFATQCLTTDNSTGQCLR
ncbi:DUF2278 family protein [Bacillus toyonensis]|uniref:DUF2278 family protein n=3 Tax=Bacillus toyonensis TaxID=155322 RepID=UPI000BEDD366|nr:DUF2278 family protein [Bacillus toyonensis]PDZ86092.1 hypothetical protein CON93_06975 [Bacillus toyonensis]PEA71074.1 hypothetical protein COO00_19000 [Bacillus toyonensis]